MALIRTTNTRTLNNLLLIVHMVFRDIPLMKEAKINDKNTGYLSWVNKFFF